MSCKCEDIEYKLDAILEMLDTLFRLVSRLVLENDKECTTRFQEDSGDDYDYDYNPHADDYTEFW